MSGTKFFVHGGGTWREVDENSGRVSGWGKIQFVYLSRGRLVVARRNSVLRGLRALLAGKSTTVRDGSRLQVIRPKVKKEKKVRQNESSNCNCCTCQHAFHHNHQFATDVLFNKLLKQNTSSTATQCVLTPDSPVEVIQKEQTNTNTQTEEKEKCTETEDGDNVPVKAKLTRKMPLKELIIDENDVLLVRTFIENDRRNIFEMSLVDYDADDNCKKMVFYKINPLVVVEKSKHIAQMIRPPSQCSNVSFQEFIAHLGLQSIHEVSKSSKYRMRQRKNYHTLKKYVINNSDNDKENIKTSTSRTNINNRTEKRPTRKSLLGPKHNKTQINEAKRHYEPLKLKVTSDLKKNSGVKNNSLLNMRRTFRHRKDMKINKNERKHGSVDDSKKIVEDENIPQKSFKSRRHTAEKSLTKSNHKNQSTKVSSDFEESADSKEKHNQVRTSRNLSSVTRDRPTVPVDKKSRMTEESTKKSATDTIKVKKQLSESLPTKTIRNKKTELPFEPSSDDDTFQDDKTKGKSKSKNGENETDSGELQNGKPKHNRKTSQKPNTSSRGVIRAYSRAEDEAIVSFLKAGDRANLVNGNRIWKEMKPEHYKTTGHHRPWQSLRNRYLRYVLPALASLAVPPALAQKLRAAAAQGEIKSRINSNSANNSIFKSAPVRSAWALRPRSLPRSPSPPPCPPAPTHEPTPPTITSKSLRNRTQTPTPSTSKSAPLRGVELREENDSDSSDTSGANRVQPKRKLRSSGVQSPTLPTPKAKDRRDSLTYSELTRRFASRHRSTPHSDSPNARSEKRRRGTSESSDSSHSSDASAVSDDHIKSKRVTRNDSKTSPSLLSARRRSKRLRSRSVTPERPKTRRLYNPRAI